MAHEVVSWVEGLSKGVG